MVLLVCHVLVEYLGVAEVVTYCMKPLLLLRIFLAHHNIIRYVPLGLAFAGDVFERAIAATAEAEHAGKATWDRELAAAAHQLLVEWQQELLEDD